MELNSVDSDCGATAPMIDASEPALLLAGKFVGRKRNTRAAPSTNSSVDRRLQSMVVQLKVLPIESFLSEATPEENPKNTIGIKINPPSCTNSAVAVYMICWYRPESPNRSVAASPKAVAAR
jgi:hypothetical protein